MLLSLAFTHYLRKALIVFRSLQVRISFHLLSSSFVLSQILKLLIRMTPFLMGREEYDKFFCFSYCVQSTILGVIIQKVQASAISVADCWWLKILIISKQFGSCNQEILFVFYPKIIVQQKRREKYEQFDLGLSLQ